MTPRMTRRMVFIVSVLATTCTIASCKQRRQGISVVKSDSRIGLTANERLLLERFGVLSRRYVAAADGTNGAGSSPSTIAVKIDAAGDGVDFAGGREAAKNAREQEALPDYEIDAIMKPGSWLDASAAADVDFEVVERQSIAYDKILKASTWKQAPVLSVSSDGIYTTYQFLPYVAQFKVASANANKAAGENLELNVQLNIANVFATPGQVRSFLATTDQKFFDGVKGQIRQANVRRIFIDGPNVTLGAATPIGRFLDFGLFRELTGDALKKAETTETTRTTILMAKATATRKLCLEIIPKLKTGIRASAGLEILAACGIPADTALVASEAQRCGGGTCAELMGFAPPVVAPETPVADAPTTEPAEGEPTGQAVVQPPPAIDPELKANLSKLSQLLSDLSTQAGELDRVVGFGRVRVAKSERDDSIFVVSEGDFSSQATLRFGDVFTLGRAGGAFGVWLDKDLTVVASGKVLVPDVTIFGSVVHPRNEPLLKRLKAAVAEHIAKDRGSVVMSDPDDAPTSKAAAPSLATFTLSGGAISRQSGTKGIEVLGLRAPDLVTTCCATPKTE